MYKLPYCNSRVRTWPAQPPKIPRRLKVDLLVSLFFLLQPSTSSLLLPPNIVSLSLLDSASSRVEISRLDFISSLFYLIFSSPASQSTIPGVAGSDAASLSLISGIWSASHSLPIKRRTRRKKKATLRYILSRLRDCIPLVKPFFFLPHQILIFQISIFNSPPLLENATIRFWHISSSSPNIHLKRVFHSRQV